MIPVLCLVLGALLGKFILPAALSQGVSSLTMPVLAAMVFFAGYGAGGARLGERLHRYRWRVFLLPLATAVGSIVAGGLGGVLLGIPLGEGAAVSAGFAYYSVSAGLLTDLGGPWLGALALAANLFRELLAFAFIPLVAKRLDPLAAMSIGGATSMDVTLPVISACCGEEVVVLAMVHGIVLTLAAPVLVPLLYRIF